MIPNRFFTLLLVSWITIGSSVAGADEPAVPEREDVVSDDAYTQDDLFRFLEDELEVNIASQLATRITEVPQAVYVITREEIERSTALTLADLLRQVPGINVATPTAGQWSVGVEAPTPMNTALLLVMVDGRSIHATYSTANEWWPVAYAPEDIERVEIVLGPSTAVHGSRAIFGVVNFITRNAAEQGATLRATVGGSHGADLRARFGDVNAHGAGTVHLGPIRFRGAAGYTRLTPTDDAPSYRDGRVQPQPIAQRGFANLRAETELGADTELLLLAAASAYEGPYVSFGPGVAQGFGGQLDAELKHRNLLSDGDQLTLRTYYRHKRRMFEAPFNNLLPETFLNLQENSALARAAYTTALPANNRLAAVIEARLDNSDIEIVEPPGHTYGYFSVLAQDEFRPIEPLIFTGGLRLETQYRDGLDFFERLVVMPQLSTVWLPADGHGLRLAYGQAMDYKAGFFEFGDGKSYGGALQIYRGEPDTAHDPMHIWELGYRGQILPPLLITLSYALRVITARFWTQPNDVEILPLTYERIPGTEVRHSLDATASFRPSSIVRMDMALSWVHADRSAAYAETVGSVPEWRISGRAHLAPSDRVRFDVDLQYIAAREARFFTTSEPIQIAGWLYLNVKLTYRFMDAPRLEIFGLATNLTDSKLGEGVQAEMADVGVSRVGRRFLLGLSAEF